MTTQPPSPTNRPMMRVSLETEARIAKELRARLAEAYSLAEDDAAIDDTISGECNLTEMLNRIVGDIASDEHSIQAIDAHINELNNRVARLDRRIESARALVKWALGEAGFTKMKLPEATLTISNPSKPKMVIDDGAVIPSDFLKPAPQVLDKAKLRETLEYMASHPGEGEPITWARLSNAEPVLTIRRS